MRSCLLLILVVTVVVADDDVQALCQSVEGSASCGQCIKQHPDCAWCRDPHSTTASRCQEKSRFSPDVCAKQYVYSPTTQLILPPTNLALEAVRKDGQSVVQISPQAAHLKLKPGATLEVPFQYLHKKSLQGYEVRDVQILTSEVKTRGISIIFEIQCEGEIRTDGRCPNVKEGQIVDITAKVTLTECQSTGDVAVSVGVYGYNTVSALFITPLCGCECEKLQQQEKLSSLCYNKGDLICGRCECQPGQGGPRCKCPLEEFGVNSADELDDRCRSTPESLICSGKGTCDCGVCKCEAATVTGKFCDCDHASCPANAAGQPCSAQGVCECGTCKCEAGFSGPDCSCSNDVGLCTENGVRGMASLTNLEVDLLGPRKLRMWQMLVLRGLHWCILWSYGSCGFRYVTLNCSQLIDAGEPEPTDAASEDVDAATADDAVAARSRTPSGYNFFDF